MFGNTLRGILKSFSSSSSQSSVSRRINCVRLAFVTSVTCSPPRGPPVRFQSIQVSMVPNINSPASACARAFGTLSSSHLSFSPLK
jgi:hypothetical protein